MALILDEVEGGTLVRAAESRFEIAHVDGARPVRPHRLHLAPLQRPEELEPQALLWAGLAGVVRQRRGVASQANMAKAD